MYDPMNEENNRGEAQGGPVADEVAAKPETGGAEMNEMPASPEMPQAPELEDAPELTEPQFDTNAGAASSAWAAQEESPSQQIPQQMNSQPQGEYHYGPDRQYTEPQTPPSGPQSNAAPQGQPQQPDGGNRNPQYPYGASGYPYTQRPFEQPNRNPYSPGGQQQYRSQPGQQPNQTQQPGSGYPYGGYQQQNPYAYSEQRTATGKKKNGGRVLIALLSVLAVVIIVALITHVAKSNKIPENSDTPSASASQAVTSQDTEKINNLDEATTASSPKQETVAGQMSATDIYNKVLPSSVGILVYSNGSKSISSEGSGVIIQEDSDGKYTYILTCAHVVRGVSQSIVVQLYNEKQYTAEVVGYDSRTDIGVIRIEENGLQPMIIGDSSSLSVGETIYAIGNPGGTEFANTFTNGIVTALDRPVASSSTSYTMECIQHNAAINPGNSGGALLNQYGQLIGINSMKIVDNEYEGMGFAVPSSVFVEVMNEIVANGYVTNRPKIGITYLRASSQQAYAMFVAIKGLPGGSIIVDSVTDDSDFKGKLNKGDLITAINGEDLKSSADLAAMIEDMKVGDSITLHVVRINTDYTFEETDVHGVLVEDKQNTILQDETTTYNSFEDFFGDYFDDYFGNGYGFGNP